jgi:hypothetical protein
MAEAIFLRFFTGSQENVLTLPLSQASSPQARRSSVVLPDPPGPITPVAVPSGMQKLISDNMNLLTFSKLTIKISAKTSLPVCLTAIRGF